MSFEVQWGDLGLYKPEIEFTRRIIPQEKFVEYEPSDLAWMIPLGMAPEIQYRMLSFQQPTITCTVKFDCNDFMRDLFLPGQQ